MSDAMYVGSQGLVKSDRHPEGSTTSKEHAQTQNLHILFIGRPNRCPLQGPRQPDRNLKNSAPNVVSGSPRRAQQRFSEKFLIFSNS